jgi:YegS/Rv2252/BmrU family lipid kinase
LRYHVILNPTSGSGAGARIRGELERELARRGLEFSLVLTERPLHAVELARQAALDGVDVVVAAGGDGTNHQVEHRPALGVIPVGTGNDFSKLLEGRASRPRAYDALVAAQATDFDAGYVTWPGGAEYFINGMGTGVDVEVVRQIKRLPRLPAIAGYLIALLRSVVGFKAIPLRVSADGRESDRLLMIIAIGNGPCLGGGFWLFPSARPDDGRFDICMVGDLSYFQIALTIPRVMRGTHEKLPVVTMDLAHTIELTAPGAAPLFFHLDGELREPADAHHLRVELHRGVLPVLGARSFATPAAAGPGAYLFGAAARGQGGTSGAAGADAAGAPEGGA